MPDRSALEPSEFLEMIQYHYRDELQHLMGKAPKFRCFDCKRWIPAHELPLRCSECSGPSERVKRHRYSKIARKLITHDAMVCKNCVNKHDHLCKMVLDTQMQAYAHGLEKRATMRAMKNFTGVKEDAGGRLVQLTDA